MKYFLRKANEKESYIFMDINFQSFRIKITTGYIVNTDYWNEKSQRVSSKQDKHILINSYLITIRGKVEEYVAKLKIHQNNLTKEEFSNEIKNILFPEIGKMGIIKEPKEIAFLKYFEDWIVKRKESNLFSVGRVKRYYVLLNLLKEFEMKTKFKLSFQSIDKKFYDKFVSFSINNKRHVNNTIGTSIKVLKAFLNDVKDEVGDELNYQFKNFKAYKDPEPPTIALTEEELHRIETIELKSHGLQKVRDLFIIQTYTLLRISDLKQIDKNHIDIEKKNIILYQIKTGDKISIPLPDKCMAILEKWDYVLPKISDQKYNDYIKEVCRFAGIDSKIEIVRYSGSKRIVEVKPKYDLVSSHTARRTGITLLIKENVPLNIIMKITGHKKIETMMKYVRITNEEANELLRNTWNKK